MVYLSCVSCVAFGVGSMQSVEQTAVTSAEIFKKTYLSILESKEIVK